MLAMNYSYDSLRKPLFEKASGPFGAIDRPVPATRAAETDLEIAETALKIPRH